MSLADRLAKSFEISKEPVFRAGRIEGVDVEPMELLAGMPRLPLTQLCGAM